MSSNSEINRIKVENLLNRAPARGMSSHRRTPSAGDLFVIPCDVPNCSRKFASTEALVGHKKRVHPIPTENICKPCRSSFSTPANLSKHKRRVHGKLRPFRCEKCSFDFSFKDGLQRHTRMVHEQLRPYICRHCSLMFKTKAHLTSHSLSIHPETHKRASSSEVGSSSKFSK